MSTNSINQPDVIWGAIAIAAKIRRPVPATYRMLCTGTLPGARKIKGRYAFSPSAFNAALAGVAA